MLTLFHDYTSPASAVAVARLRRLAGDGVRAQVVGTEVLGVETVLPVTIDLLAELDAVMPAAAAEGIVLRRPTGLPPTATAHLVEDVARAHGLDDAWRARCYEAFWAAGADIADPAVLVALAEQAGLPRAVVADAIGDRVALLAIRRRFAGHRRDGVGGVPTISYDRTLIPGLLDDADLLALAGLDPGA
jgi:predicted DsbA family dithiol-disulfide isomerase